MVLPGMAGNEAFQHRSIMVDIPYLPQLYESYCPPQWPTLRIEQDISSNECQALTSSCSISHSGKSLLRIRRCRERL